jgi:endo-1,4-beta-xylanase
MSRIVFLIFCCVCFTACSNDPQTSQTPATSTPSSSTAEVSLAGAYKDYFKIGAAIDQNSYKTHEAILKKHFNGIVTENEMKFESLQPKSGEYSFATADAMIKFARDNGMETRGHALVWHRQTPDWVFKNADGETASPEELRQRMKDHIFTVMRHFKGRIDAWDVVNEAVMDDGKMRTHLEEADDQKSAWYGILGEAYIEEAFRMAHEADPDAKLFYNDYYNYIPARQNAIYNMLKTLKEKGVPIHGVGLQAHLNIEPSTNPNHQSYHQTIENLEKAINMYASLGLEVHITELDVSVYIGGNKYEEKDFYTPETFTAELQAKQAERYKALFDMFRRNSSAITNVTFWGIADDNTWLSEFDSGRQDFPMLFDINHQPKPAFNAVVGFE